MKFCVGDSVSKVWPQTRKLLGKEIVCRNKVIKQKNYPKFTYPSTWVARAERYNACNEAWFGATEENYCEAFKTFTDQSGRGLLAQSPHDIIPDSCRYSFHIKSVI